MEAAGQKAQGCPSKGSSHDHRLLAVLAGYAQQQRQQRLQHTNVNVYTSTINCLFIYVHDDGLLAVLAEDAQQRLQQTYVNVRLSISFVYLFTYLHDDGLLAVLADDAQQRGQQRLQHVVHRFPVVLSERF